MSRLLLKIHSWLSHKQFAEDFKELKKISLDDLRKKAWLQYADKRFNQLYVDRTTKRMLMDVPVDKIYHKYFVHPANEWPKQPDFIVKFAKKYYEEPKVLNIIDFTFLNPRITVSNLKGEIKYNIFDGMHRVIAYIKAGKKKIPAIVIRVENDF